MKSLGAALAAVAMLTSCAAGTSTAHIAPNPDRTHFPPSVETWCAGRSADRCVEALLYLQWNPHQEPCVVATVDESESFWSVCSEDLGLPPVTTVSPPYTQSGDAGVANLEAETARTIALVDERASALLAETHPDEGLTVGVVLAEPVLLSAVEELAASFGGYLIAAWRTDFVCLAGLNDWPVWSASRFAYVDGVERANRLREQLENSTTPVTGAHIPLQAFAVMEQEARALRAPEVLIEAVRLRVPVAALPRLRNDARVERVRLADFPVEWLDLSDPILPDCNGE